jgi:hypothetical protein
MARITAEFGCGRMRNSPKRMEESGGVAGEASELTIHEAKAGSAKRVKMQFDVHQAGLAIDFWR